LLHQFGNRRKLILHAQWRSRLLVVNINFKGFVILRARSCVWCSGVSVRIATCDCSSPLRSSSAPCVPAKIANDVDDVEDEDAAEDEET
jgi:hypothetical protein